MKDYPTIFGINEVFTMLGQEALNIKEVNKKSRTNLDINGFKVYRESLRYATFYQKGTKCACCGKEGAYFKLEEDIEGKGLNRRHFNLYAEDGTLITKDHIRPRKLNGKDHIDNMQTMCEICNKAKGSKYDIMLSTIVGRNLANPEKELNFLDLEDAVVHICDKRHLLSRSKKPGKLARQVVDITKDLIHALTVNEPYDGYNWFIEDRLWQGKSYEE